MQIHEMAKVRLLVNSLAQRIDWKIAAMAGALSVLVLFGDSLFPLLGHGLYLLVELAEQETESFLEWAFGLTTRQSQVVIVWVGLPIIGFISWRLSRKAYAAARARWLALVNWINGDWSTEEWFRMALVLGVLSTLLFLLA